METDNQEEIIKEVKILNSRLNKLLVRAIVLILGFIAEWVVLILGIVPFDLLAVIILAVLPLGVIQNIKKGREINLQIFLLNLFKTKEDGK